MRKLIFILAFTASTASFAQMDNVVEVENNFRPTVKDADKINTLPEIEQTTATHYNVNYTTQGLATSNYAFEPMFAAQNPQLIRSDKKGFVTLGYGNNSNAIGRLAYGFDLSKHDVLNVEISSRGHLAEIEKAYSTEKWESRFFTTQFQMEYEHILSNVSSLRIGGSYGTDVFNYQQPQVEELVPDKQHNNRLEFHVGLTPYHFGHFTLGADASVATFRQKYLTNALDFNQETALHGSLTPGYQINDEMAVDLQLLADHFNYGPDYIEGHTSLAASPHFRFHNSLLDITAGLYINKDIDIAPDVNVALHLLPQLDIYAQAEGGETFNSFRRFAEMTPYWVLSGASIEMKPQFDQLRARGGVRIRPFDGLSADLNAGYNISQRRAELLTYGQRSDVTPTYTPVVFADGKQFFANARVKFDYQGIVSADLDAQYNIWKSDFRATDLFATPLANYDEICSWRPVFEGNCTLAAHPVKGLTIGADFIFRSYKNYTNLYQRENVMNLGATLSYTFPFRLTVYAKGDNLMNRKYDQYEMYRSPGVNFLGGLALTF